MAETVLDQADRQWCQEAAGEVVAELIKGSLFDPDQKGWAYELVEQVLQTRLKAGNRPAPATAAAFPDYARGLRDAGTALVMSNQTIRLHAGELTTDEMRCVQAVLGWRQRELLARAEQCAAPNTNRRPAL